MLACQRTEKSALVTRFPEKPSRPSRLVTLFLSGDVMTGRGIDQVLPHPSEPRIYESYVRSAVGYVKLAEEHSGPIPRPVEYSYIWGAALEELERARPDVRIINLETAVTTAGDYWKGKGINYRMHPGNVPCLASAGIDCCALANNHVLDWGYPGLAETVRSLETAGIRTAGAGQNIEKARAAAVMEVEEKGRVLVYSLGSVTSGIPRSWAASKDRPGVNLLKDLSDEEARRMAKSIRETRRPGDIVVASIHWGSNWGYRIPEAQQKFARRLIDEAGVDVVHGHSSHHPRAIEVYRNRPILYGCGDLLNDYEGIRGREEYRNDLALLYFLTVDASTGELERLQMTPVRIERFRLHRASEAEARWMRDVLDRECRRLGSSRMEWVDAGTLLLRWE